jgi:DNA end-binding protein Ku
MTATGSRRRKKKTTGNWRASWKGPLQFGLVSLSVEAVNAHSRSGGDIHFHLLHDKCHSRIEYQKVCPVHGEVDQDEIVYGYEYARGRYIEVEPDELDAMRTREERSLRIEEFITAEQLDSMYLDGRVYYLIPAETHDREPYHLLRKAMEDEDRIGVGQVVFSGKEQLAAILPRDQLLVMAMLNYATEIRDPAALATGGIPLMSAKNLKLAKELVHSMSSRHFSLEHYKDRYRERVKDLIESKRKGKSVEPPEEEEPPVINLMEALKGSLSRSKKHAGKKNTRVSRHRRTAAS